MSRHGPYLFLILLLSTVVLAQPRLTPEQDSIIKEMRRQTQEDYKTMLVELNILPEDIRPGANGRDTTASNRANYKESKANPFPEYPDPLISNVGLKINNEESWWDLRRKEITEHFDSEFYGRIPVNEPEVRWDLQSTEEKEMGDYLASTKTLIGVVDNSQFPTIDVNIELTVTVPVNAPEGVPVIIQFGFSFPPWFNIPVSDEVPAWQLQLLEKGWGFAIVKAGTIQPDNGAGLREGIIGLVNRGKPRKPDDWGSLRAWAWGASRVLDYLESDESVDAEKVGITGHSRYGKAALVTMAYDPRFAIGYISSSGAAGAKPHRRNFGEIVENVAGSGEYHWMAGNYIKYAGPLGWDDLPVDSHHLLAMCAPRPVFVGSGDKGDQWVDPRGMFMACVGAGPVYRLLGKRDLGTTVFPELGTSVITGDIAYRQHEKGHTPAPNWAVFIEFASRYLDKKI